MFYSILAFLVYYIVWTVVLPFVEEGHVMRRYFLDIYYAAAVPMMTMVTLLSLAVGTIAIHMIRYGDEKKHK